MIYFTDGSKDGFLTAFVLAFKDDDSYITSTQKQLTLGQKSVFVPAEKEKAEKTQSRLLSFDKDCMRELDLLLRSGRENREQIANRYLHLLAQKKLPVRDMLAEDAVTDAMDCIHTVTLEVHRLHGFVRFLESASGALYAPLSPVADVVDLLVPHFRKRLPDFPFVLHDVRRKKAAVFDGKNSFLAPLDQANLVLSADETAWQQLWKQYFASVNIPERQRLRQMRACMPVRYWKFLTELN